MEVLIAIVVILILVAGYYYMSRPKESFTKIYRGVGADMGTAAGIITGTPISDMKHVWWDGSSYQSCDLCSTPYICPHCPQFAN